MGSPVSAGHDDHFKFSFPTNPARTDTDPVSGRF